MRDFAEMGAQLDHHRIEHPRATARLPTPFVWRDPLTMPPRPWLYGRHLLRKQMSVTVAPGGVGNATDLHAARREIIRQYRGRISHAVLTDDEKYFATPQETLLVVVPEALPDIQRITDAISRRHR